MAAAAASTAASVSIRQHVIFLQVLGFVASNILLILMGDPSHDRDAAGSSNEFLEQMIAEDVSCTQEQAVVDQLE
uniref:Uncharacterized protein n=1 Tax=Oryza glumipatula TaxID=40148 RepID=A0A0D9ZIZ5_9ORYZ